MKKYMELLFLKQFKGLGNSSINRKYIPLLENIDGIEECIKLVEKKEQKYSHIDIEKARQIAEGKYKKNIDDLDINIITIFDEEYPEHFHDLKDKKPIILYIKGDVGVLKEKSIAIVGTRKPSKWSEKVESKLVQKIIELTNRVIISGLALGCDRIAHESTVSIGEKTIAVLPSGVNVITPASQKKLAEKIVKNNGCLISEYEPDAKVTRSTYVERDALIAALADSTLVIECGVKSGTMHTVNAAEKIDRILACYYTDEVGKGNYEGNKYMLSEKGAIKVSDTDELVVFLKKLDEYKKEVKKDYCQLSCLD